MTASRPRHLVGEWPRRRFPRRGTRASPVGSPLAVGSLEQQHVHEILRSPGCALVVDQLVPSQVGDRAAVEHLFDTAAPPGVEFDTGNARSFNRKSGRRPGQQPAPAFDRAGSREWCDPRASRHLGPEATSLRDARSRSSSRTSRGSARRQVETCVPATALGRHAVPLGPKFRAPAESRRAPETVHGNPLTCSTRGWNASDVIVLPRVCRDTRNRAGRGPSLGNRRAQRNST